MDKLYYVGIGSRTAPEDILTVMTKLAQYMAANGYGLRSGGADGSDKAFEKGAGDDKEILRPKHATEEAIELASKFHPAWYNCNPYVRTLHGRNAQIILGFKLNAPASVVYCWTPINKANQATGGTGLGMRIAKHYNIPVKNLFIPEILKEVEQLL